jgi:predicted MarR family transcription regulator
MAMRCERYLAVREKALVESLKADDVDFSRLDETARALGRLTRYYAHASRAATVAPRKG